MLREVIFLLYLWTGLIREVLGAPVTVLGGGTNSINFYLKSLGNSYQLVDANFQFMYSVDSFNSSFQNLIDGNTDFQITDEVLTETSITGTNLKPFPFSGSAIVPIYNIPSSAGNQIVTLSGPILAGVLNQTITRWNHPSILNLNSGMANWTGIGSTIEVILCTQVTTTLSRIMKKYDAPSSMWESANFTQLSDQVSTFYAGTL
jgi:ABC-type phosphate transport system substrate-binding protein